MANRLPHTVVKYSESPLFNEKTVPDKLTLEHSTKEGVWGKVCVSLGALDYVIPGPEKSVQRISAGEYGIIRPAEIHFVEVNEPVEFKVEFYRETREDSI